MALGESFDALQVQDDEEKRSGEEPNDKVKDDEENDDYKEEEEEDDSQLSSESQRQLGESRLVELSGVQTESRAAQLRTLVESDQSVGLKVNSALEEKHVEAEFKERNGMPNQELLESAAVNCAEPQIQSELKSSVCPTSLSDLSPTSVTQSISSAASPTLPEQRMSPSKCVPEADQQGSSGLKSKTLVVVPSVKTPVPDGYNWRKYGQKQVKSPKGSRSYYRCTFSDCFAKKIECSDHSGNVIEIVNKGTHTHDPPRKNSSSRQNKVALTVGSTSLNGGTEHPIRTLRDSDPATLSNEPVQEVSTTLDRKRQNSSGSKGDIEVKEEQFNEPEPKRRLKKIHLECSETILKPEKKPKFIVHAAGDVGISGDGYRWRKYGQKMVKGNSHPRNYYRCTSAGCPARKHIETAVNNTNAVIITYKGVHDHDMPVPKKRHGPPSASLVAAAAAAPTSMHNLQLKITDTSQNQVTSTQWSVGKEGELTAETLELGGEKEKAIESARTLLSIGFEIKPC